MKNTGARSGDVVVLAYFRPVTSAVGTRSQALKSQLFDFKRLNLDVDETANVDFAVKTGEFVPLVRLFERFGVFGLT